MNPLNEGSDAASVIKVDDRIELAVHGDAVVLYVHVTDADGHHAAAFQVDLHPDTADVFSRALAEASRRARQGGSPWLGDGGS